MFDRLKSQHLKMIYRELKNLVSQTYFLQHFHVRQPTHERTHSVYSDHELAAGTLFSFYRYSDKKFLLFPRNEPYLL